MDVFGNVDGSLVIGRLGDGAVLAAGVVHLDLVAGKRLVVSRENAVTIGVLAEVDGGVDIHRLVTVVLNILLLGNQHVRGELLHPIRDDNGG